MRNRHRGERSLETSGEDWKQELRVKGCFFARLAKKIWTGGIKKKRKEKRLSAVKTERETARN